MGIKTFKATRSSAMMVCGKNTNNLIQLLLAMEYLPLVSPCFLKTECRGMCAVGTVRALGPACLLFSTPSTKVDYSKLFRQEHRHVVSLP